MTPGVPPTTLRAPTSHSFSRVPILRPTFSAFWRLSLKPGSISSGRLQDATPSAAAGAPSAASDGLKAGSSNFPLRDVEAAESAVSMARFASSLSLRLRPWPIVSTTGLLSGAGPSRTLIFESGAAGATVLGTAPNGSSFLPACVPGPEAAAAPALPTTFSFSETTRTSGSSSEVTEMVKLPSMPASCGAANATYGRPPLRGGSCSESERRSLVERLVFSTMPTKSVMRPSNFSPFITHAPKRNLASRSCRTNSIWYVAFSTLGYMANCGLLMHVSAGGAPPLSSGAVHLPSRVGMPRGRPTASPLHRVSRNSHQTETV